MAGKFLLGFDGSEQSGKALDEAIRIAKGLGEKLVVLHVYWIEAADVYTYTNRMTTEDTDIEGNKMFTKVEERLKREGVDYELKSVRSNDAPSAIMETAVKERCDMIIIGNRGVGRVRGFFLGSVAEKVAANAKVSVLLVK